MAGENKKAEVAPIDPMVQMMLFQADPIALLGTLKQFGVSVSINEMSAMMLKTALIEAIGSLPAADAEKVKTAVMFSSMSGGGQAGGFNPAMFMMGGLGGGQAGGMNPMMMSMLMSQMGGAGKGGPAAGGMNPMLLMSMLGGQGGGLGDIAKNPMLLMSLLGGGKGGMDMNTLLMMQMMNKPAAASGAATGTGGSAY
jgi:hypothetical protein